MEFVKELRYPLMFVRRVRSGTVKKRGNR
jgi:hypothetical protein